VCSPQAWVSAAVLRLAQVSLGRQFDPAAREIRFELPMLPARDHLHVWGLRLRDAEADVLLHSSSDEVAATMTRRRGKIRIVIVH
jgi:glycogen debranching enzyme